MLSGGFESDNWLITPRTYLPTGESIVLSFHVRSQGGDLADNYEILVSTTGTDIEADDFTLVFSEEAEGEWTRREVDLSSYAGENVYIAFRHNDENKRFILLDEIRVFLGELSPGTVSGVVTDEDNLPVEGVVVLVVGTELQATTTANGMYNIPNLPVGKFTVTATKEGYEDYTSIELTMLAGGTLTHNIRLNKITSEDDIIGVPVVTALNANFPNPFNPSTMISFDIAQEGHVKIEIFNIRGQRVRTLVNDHVPVGSHKVEWNGTDDFGRTVGTGIYFYNMQTGEYFSTRRMVLMK